MSENLDLALQSAVTETIENMAFMEVLLNPDAQWDPASEATLIGRQQMVEPLQCEMQLIIPNKLIGSITDVVHSLSDSEFKDDILQDVLAEILNTIAGRFFSAILPDEQAFQMGLPTVNTEKDAESELQKREWRFFVEGQPFIVVLKGDAFS